jgi:hypothetical protein
MTRVRTGLSLAGLLLLAGVRTAALAQASTNASAAPEFKEVYDLIGAHLAGMNEPKLNAVAVNALVRGLSPRVSLVTNQAGAKASADAPLVSKSSVFDGEIAYIRVSRVAEGLSKAVQDAYTKLRATNKVNGVILDLRYADGDDYASAAATADMFTKKEQPLLNWGNGAVRSKEKNEAITVPVAVLVNGQTAAAAEALAAVLREAGAGLILGSKTAGQAMIAEEFPLKNGDRLRIATAPVLLGNGTAISSQGLKPDILVDVTSEDERAYYADAYRVRSRPDLLVVGAAGAMNVAAGTNRVARRPRYNEAELVRERREGISEADMTALRDREPDKPLVSDPVLARALDLLKGLALVRQTRP